MDLFSWILTLSIVAGQLIKIPLGSGGITAVDGMVIILCLLGIYQIKFKLKKPPLFILAAGVFILICIVSLILTPLHLNSSQFLSSFFYTVRFSTYIFLGWVIYSGAFSNLKENTSRILIYSGIGLAILGLLQLIFLPDLGFLTTNGWDPHYFRTVSTFLDPNFVGAYFVLTLILLQPRRWNSFTPRDFSPFFIVFLGLLTTFSRSSYLMFLVSGLLLAFLNRSKKLFLSVLLLFCILMIGFYFYTQVIAAPRNIDREKSASFRINTWEQGLRIFQQFPVLGVGYNAYKFGLQQLNLADDQFLQSHGSTSNDSSLLFVAATTGFVGLIAYVFFLFQLFRINYLNKSYLICTAIMGLLVHSVFSNSLFYPPILLMIILSAIPKE